MQRNVVIPDSSCSKLSSFSHCPEFSSHVSARALLGSEYCQIAYVLHWGKMDRNKHA